MNLSYYVFLTFFLICNQFIQSEISNCSLVVDEGFFKIDPSTETQRALKRDWVQLWENGIQRSKNWQDLSKAIDMYSGSIDLLQQKGDIDLSFLFYERGRLNFNAGNYTSAIQDLTKALNTNSLGEREKYSAFSQRLAAYLFTGDHVKFEEESKKNVGLWLPSMLYENDEFAVFSFKTNLEGDSLLQRTATSILLAQKWISSEDQIVFSPSGKLIIKKPTQIVCKSSPSLRGAFIHCRSDIDIPTN